MTLRRRLATMTVMAILATSLTVVTTGEVTAAGAASRKGASSSVVGRGDIVTSIIRWGGSSGRRSSRPTCWWRTLSDAQLEFLVAVNALVVTGELDLPELATFTDLLVGGEPTDHDIQVRICGGRLTTFRGVPRDGPAPGAHVVARRMITRLPAPRPVTSPPAEVAVPVGTPVLWSVPAEDWRPLSGSITVDGVTAEVLAGPVELRVVSGDPAVGMVRCDGPGVPFDPTVGPVAAQAAAPDRCSVRYLTSNVGPSVVTQGPRRSPSAADRRPAAWIGTVTMVWSAQWRTGAGEWQDLGLIPRTTVFSRSVQELTTSIETLSSNR